MTGLGLRLSAQPERPRALHRSLRHEFPKSPRRAEAETRIASLNAEVMGKLGGILATMNTILLILV
jgi:hypothetical protein